MKRNEVQIANRARFDQYRVLIVDDQDSVIESVQLMLECIDDFKVETAHAHNGVEAIEKIEKFFPNLIILDAVMPGGNGDELVRKIKQDEQLKYIKILGYTALPNEAEKFLKLGVEKVIVKFSPSSNIDNFQKEVCTLLERQE